MHTDDDKNLRILDAVYHEAALLDADEGVSTREDHAWARELVASVQTRLAEIRRGLLPSTPRPAVKARPVRASLLAMGRDALLARLAEMTRTMVGRVQYAHRDLTSLSDDDLRRLVDFIEPPPSPTE